MLDHYVGAVVRKFKIDGLTEEATWKLTFCKQPQNIQNVRVLDHFKEKYEKDIIWKYLPCLILKSSKVKVYVPMELAKLSPVTRFIGKGVIKGKGAFHFENSFRNADSRCRKIADMMEEKYSVDINRPVR